MSMLRQRCLMRNCKRPAELIPGTELPRMLCPWHAKQADEYWKALTKQQGVLL